MSGKSFEEINDLSWLTEYEVEEEAPQQELSYVEFDFESGDLPKSEQQKMALNALKPKNKLQTRLLNIFGSTRFESKVEKKRWNKIQDRANPTPDGRVWLAWIFTCIEWGEFKASKKDKGRKVFPYTAVMSLIENEEAFRKFDDQHRDEILKKPTIDKAKEIQANALEDLYNEE